MTHRAFLFDLDGVLIDSQALVCDGWLRLAAALGIQLDGADLERRMFGRRTVDVLQDVFGLTPEQARAEVASGIDDRTAELAAGADLPAVPGALAFVAAAKAGGIPRALVTSQSPGNLRFVLDLFQLHDAFDAVIDAARVARGKPFPDPYLAGAAALGVDPAETVVFEDSPAGVAAAKAAGACCVALTTTVAAAQLQQADLVVGDFTGLDPAAVLGRPCSSIVEETQAR